MKNEFPAKFHPEITGFQKSSLDSLFGSLLIHLFKIMLTDLLGAIAA